jgi:hypothetical protein
MLLSLQLKTIIIICLLLNLDTNGATKLGESAGKGKEKAKWKKGVKYTRDMKNVVG